MAKRFTDTEKWKDEWYLSLDNDSRIVWQYLLDNCSIAGIMKKNFKLLNFCCNVNLDEEKLLKIFNGRLVSFENYYFIPKFIKFQYPKGLHSDKPAIVSVRQELLNKGLINSNLEMINKSLLNDYTIIKDKDKDKDKDKNKDKNKDKPFFDFEKVWEMYPKKLGRKAAEKHFKASVKTETDYNNLIKAIGNYKLELEKNKISDQFIKHGSTFFNNWQDYINLEIDVKVEKRDAVAEAYRGMRND